MSDPRTLAAVESHAGQLHDVLQALVRDVRVAYTLEGWRQLVETHATAGALLREIERASRRAPVPADVAALADAGTGEASRVPRVGQASARACPSLGARSTGRTKR